MIGGIWYFGQPWPEILRLGIPRTDTPVGQPCLRCEKPIAAGDCGVVSPLITREDLNSGLPLDSVGVLKPEHYACRVRLRLTPGTWWTSSDSDQRWNMSGRVDHLIVMGEQPHPDAVKAVEGMRRQLGCDPPADMEYGCLKD